MVPDIVEGTAVNVLRRRSHSRWRGSKETMCEVLTRVTGPKGTVNCTRAR